MVVEEMKRFVVVADGRDCQQRPEEDQDNNHR